MRTGRLIAGGKSEHFKERLWPVDLGECLFCLRHRHLVVPSGASDCHLRERFGELGSNRRERLG